MYNVKPNRRVPKGVDAQSWLGFEDRIAQRRFTTLSAIIHAAVAAGDLVSAQAAVEEARQLRPDAPELLQLEMKVLAVTPPPVDLRFWRRVTSGAALLVVGVSMVVGLESLRHVRTTPDAPEIGLDRLPVHAAVANAPAGSSALSAPILRDEPGEPHASGSPNPPGVLTAPGAAPESLPTPSVEPVRLLRARAELGGADPAPIEPARGETTRVEPVRVEPLRVEPLRVESSASKPTPAERRAILEPREARFAQADDGPGLTTEAILAETRATRSEGPPQPQPVTIPAVSPGSERQLPAQPAQKTAPPPPAATLTYTPRPVVSPPVNTTGEDESRVADVLRRYARAYGDLDAGAARDIWPTVDQRALARAFESLRSQELSLQDCQIDVRGATANASCRGQAQYVGKVGSGEPRVEPRAWRFELRRDGDAWKIANAEARRPTS